MFYVEFFILYSLKEEEEEEEMPNPVNYLDR